MNPTEPQPQPRLYHFEGGRLVAEQPGFWQLNPLLPMTLWVLLAFGVAAWLLPRLYRWARREERHPIARLLAKLVLGYIPFTLLAIAGIVVAISRSTSWEAVLGGGIFILIWSIAIALLQLLILFVDLRSRFFLKCAAITVFSVVGGPLLLQGSYWLGTEIFIGRPDLDQFVEDHGQAGCEVAAVAQRKRMGLHAYYIKATVQCPQQPPVDCSWWFHHGEDGWWASPRLPGSRCPGKPAADAAPAPQAAPNMFRYRPPNRLPSSQPLTHGAQNDHDRFRPAV